MKFDKISLKIHEKNKGKIEVISKIKIKSANDLSVVYTPGVAAPCREIAKKKSDVYKYTVKGNMVAVISDGSAVLGLGDIGPEASLPVMEGKCILFKQFGNISAFPIVLNCKSTTDIIKTIKAISPGFGAINLEDISSPRCFAIEETLEKELNIPVFHDDQHGTAIVVAAGLINAAKLIDKDFRDLKVVLNGPGAAGTAIIKMLLNIGVKNILACDQSGILTKLRTYGKETHKKYLSNITNAKNISGNLTKALNKADVFIGVSKANLLKPNMIKCMNTNPVVFALANPDPEITYENAIKSGVKIIATGRSDYPNQINNVLAFPGIFKGALSVGARNINSKMKIAAAYAIASCVKSNKLKPNFIIPSIFDKNVTAKVSQAVAKAAIESGAIRK